MTVRSILLAALLAACGPGSGPMTPKGPASGGSGGIAGDQDGDRIADDHDACPDIQEDFDGWEDADGCPEDATARAPSGSP